LLSFLYTALAFIAVLVIVVLAHEGGHFFTARLLGIKVDEFGIGYPPRIWAFKRKGIEYSVNWLPLGGFVKLTGENDPNVPGGLSQASATKRLVVLSAGAIMNALLPFLLFSIALMAPHTVETSDVYVDQVAPGSPAAAAGFQVNDQILKIDSSNVTNYSDLSRLIQLNLGNNTSFTLKQPDSSVVTLEAVPRWKPPAGQGSLGIVSRLENVVDFQQSLPPWKAIPQGFSDVADTFGLFKNGIIQLIIGAQPFQVSGPVGIAQVSGEAARAGIGPFLEFTAFLSINLAILNILPIPALDGGRIAFVLVEIVRRGKRLDPKKEGLVHTVGFILLLTLIVAITFQDVARAISGSSVVP